MGAISVRCTEIVLLAKSLLPLPEKFHGLKDQEMRYRQRYVDLIMNPEVKDTFIKRSLIMRELRAFLDSKGFLEVDTPILTPFEIGASARPFMTHHNTLDMDMVLRIETELYLKRLIVGGMDRVYEIGRIFRNEGMDPKHNPEFTSVELYQAYADFHDMMDIAEGIISGAAKEILGTYEVEWMGEKIDLTPGWRRLTMRGKRSLAWVKSVPPRKMLTTGIIRSLVTDLVMLPKAPPMMVPTASAMAFPLTAKAVNSSIHAGFFIVISLSVKIFVLRYGI